MSNFYPSCTLLKCTLPKKYHNTGTFIIRPNISCGSNIFMHVAPIILAQMMIKYQHDPYQAARASYRVYAEEFGGKFTSINHIEDKSIFHKDQEIPLRIYREKDPKKNQLIFYVHGGGWNKGDLDTHDAICRQITHISTSTVVSVDYRLAPENPYPAGFNDIVNTYSYLTKNLKQINLNADADIICVGDSAGGNLVAALNLWLIDHKLPLPLKNILIYPALDLRIPKITENPYADGYLLTQPIINYYIQAYVKNLSALETDVYLSPFLLSEAHAKAFPKTLIIGAECDPLCEQGKRFSDKLQAAGNNNIEHYTESKTIHGYAQFFGLFDEAYHSLSRIREFLEN